MRGISAGLLAAQQSVSALPYVRAFAIRKIGDVGRLDWTRLYTGVETERQVAMAQPADGSILRIHTTDPGGVQIQRIASPGAGSAWGTWPAQTATPGEHVAICAYGVNAWAFYADTNDGKVCGCSSTNSGATWSAWAEIAGAGDLPNAIAATMADANTVLVVFNRGATVYTCKRSGGAWGAVNAWTRTVASVTGIAVCYAGDWNIVLTGTEATTTNPKVWTCLYGDGFDQTANTWSTLTEMTGATAGSGVSYADPSLTYPDVFRCFFLEIYTGTTAYRRPYFSHSLPSATFKTSLWLEPVPFNYEPATYGPAIAYTTGDYVYLANNAGVWRAPLVQGTGLELTSAVTALVATTSPTGGSAKLSLDNSPGTYNTLGSGDNLELDRGSRLDLWPGYKTTAGNEVAASQGPAYWIQAVGYATAPGRCELVLEAVDGWGLLRAWRARKQQTWASGAKTIFNLLAWIFARVGLELTGGSSSELAGVYPAFIIQPGESGYTAAIRLLARIPERVVWAGGTATLVNPQAADASTYTYGVDHAILSGNYSTRLQEANHAQVQGNTPFSESFTWAEIALTYNRLLQDHDIALTAAAETLARANAHLREAAIAGRQDQVTTLPYPGQDLLDVVTITDSRAGLTAATRRILELQLDYLPRKAIYQQTLKLGAP